MTGTLDEIITRLNKMPEGDRKEILAKAKRATAGMKHLPNPGPQTDAFFCEADELFYGGEAGGGKTDLLLDLALNNHRRSLILRRLNGEVEGLVDRLIEIIGTDKGVKRSAPQSYRTKDKIILFGGCQFLHDRKKYQGVPKDLIGFDEIANFLKDQYTFIKAWARSTFPGQRVRVVVTGNPPTTAEGMWVIDYWGPWLDQNHPNPALPGELRWFTTIDGKDCEVPPGPVMLPDEDGELTIPYLDEKGRPVLPKSRTFIPAELYDNPDLAETDYSASLAGLPEELRLAMAQGDFTAGMEDKPHQVFPTEYVDAAMARWNHTGDQTPMNVLAADIAQGGTDNTILAPRHGSWFAKLKVYPGKNTPDGPVVAGLIMTNMRNGCEVIIDMGGGYGGDTNTQLKQGGLSPTLFNGASSAEGIRDKTGMLKFRNLRAAAHWGFRDALDPTSSQIALPPDPELKAELTSIMWTMTAGGILIEEKAAVKKRVGRSPDRADAVIMAWFAKGKTNGARSGIGNLQKKAHVSGRNPRSK